MKKLFAFATAIIFALSLNAKQVVFDFTTDAGLSALSIAKPEAGAGTNVTSATLDGVTMTTTNGGTATRVWNSNGATTLRVYGSSSKHGSLTFAASENISAVAFEGTIAFDEITSGKVWQGTAAQSVTFTAGTSNSTISKITVYIGETPEAWVPDTVTVTDTKALIAASDKKDHFVKGVVKDIPFITYDEFKGKVSFWMSDAEHPADTIEFYDGFKAKGSVQWASLQEVQETLRVGDTILVYAGELASYTPQGGAAFNEITGGYLAEILGKNPNPDPLPTIDTITVAAAVELAQALAEEAKTKEEYIVKGFAVKVWDKNTDGTWSFGMADAPGAKYDFQASNCTTDADVATNDIMYVRGKIAKHKSTSGNIMLQIYKGTATHEIEADPDTITAAQAKTMAEALEVGAYSSKVVIDCYIAKFEKESDMYSEDYGNASPWLGDDPTSTFGQIKAYHALVSAEDGPTLAAGDHVQVEGRLSHTVNPQDNTKHYYQVAEGAKLTVIAKAQGIENVVLTEKAQKVMVDGVVYIIRDNKMFDTLGNQVR